MVARICPRCPRSQPERLKPQRFTRLASPAAAPPRRLTLRPAGVLADGGQRSLDRARTERDRHWVGIHREHLVRIQAEPPAGMPSDPGEGVSRPELRARAREQAQDLAREGCGALLQGCRAWLLAGEGRRGSSPPGWRSADFDSAIGDSRPYGGAWEHPSLFSPTTGRTRVNPRASPFSVVRWTRRCASRWRRPGARTSRFSRPASDVNSSSSADRRDRPAHRTSPARLGHPALRQSRP